MAIVALVHTCNLELRCTVQWEVFGMVHILYGASRYELCKFKIYLVSSNFYQLPCWKGTPSNLVVFFLIYISSSMYLEDVFFLNFKYRACAVWSNIMLQSLTKLPPTHMSFPHWCVATGGMCPIWFPVCEITAILHHYIDGSLPTFVSYCSKE